MAGKALWESLVHGDWNGGGKSCCGRPESREGTAGTKIRYAFKGSHSGTYLYQVDPTVQHFQNFPK